MLLMAFLTCLLALTGIGCSNDPYPPHETAGSVLYFTTSELKTLDPTVSYDAGSASVIDCIYPSYFHYHFLKQQPTATLELALGATMPENKPYPFRIVEKGKTISKQGQVWTFHIKHGLRFQDDPCFPGGKGREIIAGDFLYAFRRSADPTLSCPVLSYLQDKILGMDAYVTLNRKRAKSHLPPDFTVDVQGLQPVPNDPYAFKIILSQPYPQLRYLMTMHFTTPIAHEAIEHYGAEFARHPVGCGAYMMTEYIQKQRITLTANPNRPLEYYPSEGDPGDREAGYLQDAGKQLPLADKVVFNYMTEGITAWNLFQQGYVDIAGVSQQNSSQVLSRPGALSTNMISKGVELRHSRTPNIDYFCFNMNDPVYGGYTERRRKLRQAISLSIDSQAFLDLFSQGRGTRGQFLIPPGMFGYDPNFRNPYSQYSVERAKSLLKQAGYPNGIDPKTGDHLVLDYDIAENGAAGRQFAALVVKQIEAIGIHVLIRSWRDVVWEQRIQDNKFQFTNYGWLADYPDPENFVFLLYGPNLGINFAQYNSPEFNRLFEQMRAMEDGPERLAIILKLRAIAVEDCPWIYWQHSESLSISYNWIHNAKPHSVAFDTIKYYRVDGPRRAQLQAKWNQPNYRPLLGLALFLAIGATPAAITVQKRKNRSVRRKRREDH